MLKQMLDNIGANGIVYFQDLADTMNSVVTVFLLFLMSTLVSYKTYFINPMSCFTTNFPSGLNFENYVTSYCWVEGTNPLELHEKTPNIRDWVDSNFKNTNYYPWIPLILIFQCALFYFPKVIWKEYCVSKAGTDLQNLIDLSISASKTSISSRIESVKDIAGIIEALFHLHRDNRYGLVSDAKRKISRKFPLLIWGKRSGNGMLGAYLAVKFLYICVAAGQLILMANVLRLDNSFLAVFYDVFSYLFHGYTWKSTKYFPRVTYCQIIGIRSLGAMNNNYTAQCVLPINILNEKIYIFLFIWMIFLIALSILYSLKWLYLVWFLSPRRKLVKIYLKGKNLYKQIEEPYIEKFILEFLRLDGIFLLKMIRFHAGDVLTASVIEQLWNIYKNKYRGVDLSNPECTAQRENLTLRLEPGEQKASMKTKNQIPSAPMNEDLTDFL